jgi:hypothetical protein
VLFIGGVGRSGSTLVERVLDQVPGIHALGETHHMWERGLQDDQLCGCNNPFSECETWQAIGAEAFGGWDKVDLERVIYLRHAVDRTRRVPELLKGGNLSDDIVEYAGILSAFYRGAQKATGATLLVDSAKNLSTASLLRHVDGVALRIAHVVRDSRGVANSWTRKVKRPEAGPDEYMPEYHPAYPAFRWFTDNLGFEVLARVGTSMVTHRYEDVLAEPERHLREMLAETPLADADLSFFDGNTAKLTHPVHSVSGNPMRFKTGDLELRLDDRWTSELDPKLTAMVTAMTSPLLLRHRYPLRPSRVTATTNSTAT